MRIDSTRTDLFDEAPSHQQGSKVVHILEAYLEKLEQGRHPSRSELIREFPELEHELGAYLEKLDLLHGAAVGLRRSASGKLGLTSEPSEHTSQLGDFRIIREIGRGGMGVVYEAEQVSLGRRVALKVLPFAAALDEKQRRRFQNEAYAAAQLHHTNIVPVFAVGCDRGAHFFAMQFIEGQTLATFIEGLRQPKVTLPIRLPMDDAETVPEALHTPAELGSHKRPALFHTLAQFAMHAADALENAHQAGVVHRDIKPSNLLLDAQSHIWITDFGLARCPREAGLTATGDMIGTLRYMSPEQALGRHGSVDHRADIYSLGVTLYEMLTLEPPFKADDRQALMKQIADDEPRPPRKVNPAVPVELDTIVLKAIAKDPNARYATAQDLSDDLRRFLENKPIHARRPTLAERAVKWARRHRSMVWMTGVCFILVLVGLAGATAMVWNQKLKADDARSRMETQWRRAEANFHIACDSMFSLTACLQEPRWAQVPQLDEIRGALAEEGLRTLQCFLHEDFTDPVARLETGRAYRLGAEFWEMQGKHESSQNALAIAIDHFESLVRLEPRNAMYHSELAAAYEALGRALHDAGRIECATIGFEQADGHFRRAQQLPAHYGVNKYAAILEASDLNTRAQFLASCPQVAFRQPLEAVALARRAVELEAGVGMFWDTLGIAYYRTGNYVDAITAFEEGFKNPSRGTSANFYYLAMAHWKLGQEVKARECFAKADGNAPRNSYVGRQMAPHRKEAAALLKIEH